MLSPREDYLGSIVGGAIAAEVALYAVPATAWGGGIPGAMAAGAVGGAAGNATKQFVKNLRGKQDGFDGKDLLLDTTIGFASGGIGKPAGNLFKPMMNKVNPYSTLTKQMNTKLANNTIKSVSTSTTAKMTISDIIDDSIGTTVGTLYGSTLSAMKDSTKTCQAPSTLSIDTNIDDVPDFDFDPYYYRDMDTDFDPYYYRGMDTGPGVFSFDPEFSLKQPSININIDEWEDGSYVVDIEWTESLESPMPPDIFYSTDANGVPVITVTPYF